MDILAFFAHPDDETLLIGGTLAILAQQGVSVHYLSATRGEGGELGVPPRASSENLGQVREQELICAVEKLKGASLSFLGYVDPRVGPQDTLYPYAANLTLLAGQVAAYIRQFGAAAVITHGSQGENGHPAHVLTHQAARIAVESLGAQGPVLYTVQAIFANHPRPRLANTADPADLVIDIASGLERKVQAALCHRTQHGLFTRNVAKEVGHSVSVEEAIATVQVESLHRVWPASQKRLEDPLADALRKTGVLVKDGD